MDKDDRFKIDEWRIVPIGGNINSVKCRTEEQAIVMDSMSPCQHTAERWIVTSGIKPVDLYVYLKARFGEPNGLTMLSKNWNDSDNLIHWHYSLQCSAGKIDIICLNFRIEIFQPFSNNISDLPIFIEIIKNDFLKYAQLMSKFRGKFEKWTVFLNPYVRIKWMIEEQLTELDSLKLDKIKNFTHPEKSDDLEVFKINFSKSAKKFFKAARICLGVRMLAPVMAESFINLILFILAKPDVRADNRIYDSIVRSDIDVRIRSLHLYCLGFHMPVPYDKWEICKKFHTMMKGRNEMLHGNVDPRIQAFDKVYFEGKTPLFVDFHNFTFFSYEAALQNATPEQAMDDYQTVQDLVAHILICLSDSVQSEVRTAVFS